MRRDVIPLFVTTSNSLSSNNVMAARRWCFTINNPTPEDDPNAWEAQFVKWQLEKGEEGTPHYQGYAEFNKMKRLSACKKINARAAWFKCNGTQEQNIKYCSKPEGRIDGPWERGEKKDQGRRTDLEGACETAMESGMKAVMRDHPTECAKYYKNLEKMAKISHHARMEAKEKEAMEDVVLRPWQQALMDKLAKPPDDRTIMWYWESEGNVGKTFFARYLASMKDATILDCSKKADLIYMLRDHVGEVIIFNIVRSMDTDFMGHIYTVCESIKDDVVINTKYESCRIPMGKQHVVVFANEAPDKKKWSQDRYDTVPINTTSPWNPPDQSNKRKRSDDDDENPKKRVAIESYTMDSMYT
jgi:hypothetical protein